MDKARADELDWLRKEAVGQTPAVEVAGHQQVRSWLARKRSRQHRRWRADDAPEHLHDEEARRRQEAWSVGHIPSSLWVVRLFVELPEEDRYHLDRCAGDFSDRCTGRVPHFSEGLLQANGGERRHFQRAVSSSSLRRKAWLAWCTGMTADCCARPGIDPPKRSAALRRRAGAARSPAPCSRLQTPAPPCRGRCR